VFDCFASLHLYYRSVVLRRNFFYCRPHYIYFYELRPPMSSRHFCFCIASDLLPRSKPTLLPHVCLSVFLLTIHIHSRQRVFVNARPHNVYLNFILNVCGRIDMRRKPHVTGRPQVVRCCSKVTICFIKKNPAVATKMFSLPGHQRCVDPIGDEVMGTERLGETRFFESL